MTDVLVDSNVILDVLGDDPKWADWSESTLNQYHATCALCINPVIYTEVSIGFERIEHLEAAIAECAFQMRQIPREALFLAGKSFLSYRRRRGARTSPLPDFYIGAHAAVAGLPLLTRDTRRYATYFPSVELITPRNT